MIRPLFLFLCLLPPVGLWAQPTETEKIGEVLDAWHQAAARADFEAYFGSMAEGSVFVGTDASEHWTKAEFMEFSRPYFEQGRAWSFLPVQRHMYMAPGGRVAWFDELLDTWMQLCRGSGVLVKEGEAWKIAHYVLSMTVPNETVQPVVSLKKEHDSILKSSLLLGRPNGFKN